MGGMFAVSSKTDCVPDLFYGTDYHSHLGTVRGGLVVQNGDGYTRFIKDITNSQFRSKFEDDIKRMQGTQGLGVISDYEDQPLIIGSHLGTYALVTVGRIGNLEELVKAVCDNRRAHFSEMSGGEINPTELVATLINEESNFADGIRRVQQAVEGSCSIMLLTDEGIYAARDRYGRTPLTLGRKVTDDPDQAAMSVTMETCAFPNLDYTRERYLGPGEIVRITPDGYEVIQEPGDEMRMCAFFWVYYGFPASSYEGINAEATRNRCGAALARNDDVEVDVAAGVPDSGTGHAVGYAAERGIPYRRPFAKYTPTWPRSFMPQDQRVRNLVARMKLIPVRELIENQRLLFCDDSIVRGTQLRDTLKRVFDYDAKEVHMRSACPPLVYGCKFLNFSRSKSELDLAARRAVKDLEQADIAEGTAGAEVLKIYSDQDSAKYEEMVDWIRNDLGLTSLKYQRLDDLVEAIGLPKSKLCTFCWTGKDGHPDCSGCSKG